jgi:hypothetical protein
LQSDVAFLSGYYGFLKLANELILCTHWTPDDDPIYMGTGVIIGLSLALCLAAGAVRLNKAAAGAVRGVLWGVAATVMMGLVSSCEYGPKVGEGHKLNWLIYGVPSGALIGAFFGAVIARWMSYHSADSGEGGRATLFCHDPDRDQHSLRTGR